MSAINSVPPNIFNAEFLNSPAATAAAWISIIGTFFLIIKLAGTLFKYRKHHNKILKKSGVPAFILNTFLISISLRKLPKIDLPDKIVAVVFSVIFLFASYYFTPVLIQTLKTPPEAALLYWKSSGESFYISKKMATAATTLFPPDWEISVEDCSQENTENIERYNLLTIEHKENLCKLLTTQEGLNFLDKEITKFKKDKFFIYSVVPLTMLVLLWISLGFILTIYYSNKVRKYILTEQKKAIHCAHGEFKAEGIYAIYHELDRKNLR